MSEMKDYSAERENIISVFTETQTKLEVQNAEIAAEVQAVTYEIAEREDRLLGISKLAKANKGIIAKIKNLIA